jgi:hypothetical protein
MCKEHKSTRAQVTFVLWRFCFQGERLKKKTSSNILPPDVFRRGEKILFLTLLLSAMAQ